MRAYLNPRAWSRRTTLAVASLGTVGVYGWVLSTNPPWPLAVGFLVMLGWPMMAAFYLAGYSDAILWAHKTTDELVAERDRA